MTRYEITGIDEARRYRRPKTWRQWPKRSCTSWRLSENLMPFQRFNAEPRVHIGPLLCALPKGHRGHHRTNSPSLDYGARWAPEPLSEIEWPVYPRFGSGGIDTASCLEPHGNLGRTNAK